MSLFLSQKEAEKIDSRIKYTVFGFIRTFQKSLRQTNQFDLLIPAEITYLVLSFYDCYTLIKSQMVFDSFGMNTSIMEIINDREVKSDWNSSIRFKCAMPIAAKGNNKYNIKLIKWKVHHTTNNLFPSGHYFIGVVSNRTTDFTNTAYSGLKDPYGISGSASFGVFKGGDETKDTSYKGYCSNAKITVEYGINESQLNFYENNQPLYKMTLQTNINEITHWYPCISLVGGNTCKISEEVSGE